LAIQNQLWSHALVISCRLDVQFYQEVLSQFALQVCSEVMICLFELFSDDLYHFVKSFEEGDPMRTLYLMFAGKPKGLCSVCTAFEFVLSNMH